MPRYEGDSGGTYTPPPPPPPPPATGTDYTIQTPEGPVTVHNVTPDQTGDRLVIGSTGTVYTAPSGENVTPAITTPTQTPAPGQDIIIEDAAITDDGGIAYKGYDPATTNYVMGSGTALSDRDRREAEAWIKAHPEEQPRRRTADIEAERENSTFAYKVIKPTGKLVILDLPQAGGPGKESVEAFNYARNILSQLTDGTAIAFNAPGTDQEANFNTAGLYYSYLGGIIDTRGNFVGGYGPQTTGYRAIMDMSGINSFDVVDNNTQVVSPWSSAPPAKSSLPTGPKVVSSWSDKAPAKSARAMLFIDDNKTVNNNGGNGDSSMAMMSMAPVAVGVGGAVKDFAADSARGLFEGFASYSHSDVKYTGPVVDVSKKSFTIDDFKNMTIEKQSKPEKYGVGTPGYTAYMTTYYKHPDWMPQTGYTAAAFQDPVNQAVMKQQGKQWADRLNKMNGAIFAGMPVLKSVPIVNSLTGTDVAIMLTPIPFVTVGVPEIAGGKTLIDAGGWILAKSGITSGVKEAAEPIIKPITKAVNSGGNIVNDMIIKPASSIVHGVDDYLYPSQKVKPWDWYDAVPEVPKSMRPVDNRVLDMLQKSPNLGNSGLKGEEQTAYIRNLVGDSSFAEQMGNKGTIGWRTNTEMGGDISTARRIRVDTDNGFKIIDMSGPRANSNPFVDSLIMGDLGRSKAGNILIQQKSVYREVPSQLERLGFKDEIGLARSKSMFSTTKEIESFTDDMIRYGGKSSLGWNPAIGVVGGFAVKTWEGARSNPPVIGIDTKDDTITPPIPKPKTVDIVTPIIVDGQDYTPIITPIPKPRTDPRTVPDIPPNYIPPFIDTPKIYPGLPTLMLPRLGGNNGGKSYARNGFGSNRWINKSLLGDANIGIGISFVTSGRRTNTRKARDNNNWMMPTTRGNKQAINNMFMNMSPVGKKNRKRLGVFDILK